MWEEDRHKQGGGMDELLAALGYKVRASDMADVAQKLEQLEMVMGSAQEEGISHLASDTVHYDPTDVHSWVQSMLAKLNPEPTNTILDPSSFLIENPSHSSSILTSNSRVFNDDSEYDLRTIPRIAAYPPQNTTNNNLDFPLKL
ncbi:hypothetical protein LR48_Vigan10g076900 [Vigna angularis]|uniref:Transcriptional factor DELLA N-terminal domain-containing protein n=1 Tax=Phaseolus angularis TaxID=3914 RepID=A0A0L9VIY3_PHAAN|nr:hypothetical protein LR48_Vigan10g076900 [Vigna angularis]